MSTPTVVRVFVPNNSCVLVMWGLGSSAVRES